MREHFLALGVPKTNIFVLTGAEASRAGWVKNLERRLPKLVNPNSTVYVFFSGQGAADPGTGKPYLLPYDGDPDFLDDTAYPVSRLEQKLAALPAKRVVLALDARSVKLADAGRAPAKLLVMSATGGSPVSGTLEDQGHGAFTYYLLKGLNGEAADSKGRVTMDGLYHYMTARIADAR